ncbi:MAG: hypothetical protein AB7P76_11675 [Candidatus Melainabacteria bacterium]
MTTIGLSMMFGANARDQITVRTPGKVHSSSAAANEGQIPVRSPGAVRVVNTRGLGQPEEPATKQ